MTEIQEYIVKRDKRNAISRIFRSKDDEKAVAGWRLNLEKIRLIFDVRVLVFLFFCPGLPTSCFQTELAINKDTNANDTSNAHTTSPGIDRKGSNTGVPEVRRDVPAVHHGVVPSRPIVPGVKNDHEESRTVVSNVHRNTVESQESTNSQNRTVSMALILCLSSSSH